jgi:hypothetical protein
MIRGHGSGVDYEQHQEPFQFDRGDCRRMFLGRAGCHQDFLVRNPTYPYIVYNDLPKLENLKRILPTMYRASPVLVSGTR